MNKYRISNTASGVEFGIYEGANESEALDAMARDAGYKDHTDVEEQFGQKDGEIVVTQMDTWVAWLAGNKDGAVAFYVPAQSPEQFNVAQAGADALGVEVSEELNVQRKDEAYPKLRFAPSLIRAFKNAKR
jgi:hypothetical protein